MRGDECVQVMRRALVKIAALVVWVSHLSLASRIKLSLPHAPYREAPTKTCTLSNRWLVVAYDDGKDLGRSGTFVHASIPSWNGLLIATKTYYSSQPKLKKCLVSYRVICEQSSTYLELQDTCGDRTAKRKFFRSSRRTELHKSGLSSYFHGSDDAIKVVLAGGDELEMKDAGAEVTFTLIDPAEKTAKSYGANDFKYFIASPHLKMCQPHEYSAADFFSQATGHAYSTRLCSACRSFFKGALQNSNETISSPDAACSSAKSFRSRAACDSFGKQLVKENPSISKKFADSWEARGRQLNPLIGADSASSMTCQDIGCCPLDTDLAKTFYELMSRKSAQEDKLKQLTDLKLATEILDDPSDRQKLELLLKSKLFHQAEGPLTPFDSTEHLPPHLPSTDAECQWDYAAARCAHQEVCSYQYKFLDLTFDESCRLKVRPSRPLSDSDCTWDWKKVACAEPQFCKRSCLFGESLNQCCKLRKPYTKQSPAVTDDDIEGEASIDVIEHEGNCANPTDKQILSSPSLPDQLEAIGKKCFSLFAFSIDSEKSLKKHIELGLSPPCAVCFVDTSRCGLDNCFTLLSTKGKSHPESQTCLKQFCEPELEACSGLASSERQR